MFGPSTRHHATLYYIVSAWSEYGSSFTRRVHGSLMSRARSIPGFPVLYFGRKARRIQFNFITWLSNKVSDLQERMAYLCYTIIFSQLVVFLQTRLAEINRIAQIGHPFLERELSDKDVDGNIVEFISIWIVMYI